MTKKRESLVDRRKSTPEGLYAQAAAKLGFQVVGLLTRARDTAGITNVRLAERLGLTEGRVSQVLNGDGNVHIASVARFLRACGYELRLHAVPIDPGVPEIPGDTQRRRHTQPKVDTSTHTYGTTTGIYERMNRVSRLDTLERPIPSEVAWRWDVETDDSPAPKGPLLMAFLSIDDYAEVSSRAAQVEELGTVSP